MKPLNILIAALGLFGLSAGSAQSQTAVEAVRFLFEGESYGNIQTMENFEGFKGNTYSIFRDFGSEVGYSRTYYELDGCVLYKSYTEISKKNPGSEKSFIAKIDLNKIIDIKVDTPRSYEINQRNIIRSSFYIQIQGSDGLICGKEKSGTSIAPNKNEAIECVRNTYAEHNFNSQSNMDLQGHVRRILASYQYIKANFCKGSAF